MMRHAVVFHLRRQWQVLSLSKSMQVRVHPHAELYPCQDLMCVNFRTAKMQYLGK